MQEHHKISFEILVLLNQYFNWTEQLDELLDIFLNEEEIIVWGSISENETVKFRAASILLFRAVCLQNLERSERAARYNEEAKNILLHCTSRKCDVLRDKIKLSSARSNVSLKRYEQAVILYDELLGTASYNDDELGAIVLFEKGKLLSYQRRKAGALKLYCKLIFSCGNTEDVEVQKAITEAKQEIMVLLKPKLFNTVVISALIILLSLKYNGSVWVDAIAVTLMILNIIEG